jgi:hypothetical protein
LRLRHFEQQSFETSAQHPPHFAVVREDVTSFGTPVPHRDGTSSVYIQDPSGNNVEMLKLAD